MRAGVETLNERKMVANSDTGADLCSTEEGLLLINDVSTLAEKA